MNKLFYPAVFHKADEGGYWITFPNFPECITEGNTLENSYQMAFDALGLILSEKIQKHEEISVPVDIADITVETDSFPVIIEFDYSAYMRRHNGKAVKKTLSIPEWLNEEALALNINFSQVLQEALIAKIQQKKT